MKMKGDHNMLKICLSDTQQRMFFSKHSSSKNELKWVQELVQDHQKII